MSVLLIAYYRLFWQIEILKEKTPPDIGGAV
jgi:hypothetical protein